MRACMTRIFHDFPAGHSMDTDWFALDEEGHVGRFDTGEDGALPNRAATGFGQCSCGPPEHHAAQHA